MSHEVCACMIEYKHNVLGCHEWKRTVLLVLAVTDIAKTGCTWSAGVGNDFMKKLIALLLV